MDVNDDSTVLWKRFVYLVLSNPLTNVLRTKVIISVNTLHRKEGATQDKSPHLLLPPSSHLSIHHFLPPYITQPLISISLADRENQLEDGMVAVAIVKSSTPMI